MAHLFSTIIGLHDLIGNGGEETFTSYDFVNLGFCWFAPKVDTSTHAGADIKSPSLATNLSGPGVTDLDGFLSYALWHQRK